MSSRSRPTTSSWSIDGSTAVSLPEVPLLAVLPGTGGLTRVVDKRCVRRDRADYFCTMGEGVRGRRALEWNLVDELVPRSRLDDAVAAARQPSPRTRTGRPTRRESRCRRSVAP